MPARHIQEVYLLFVRTQKARRPAGQPTQREPTSTMLQTVNTPPARTDWHRMAALRAGPLRGFARGLCAALRAASARLCARPLRATLCARRRGVWLWQGACEDKWAVQSVRWEGLGRGGPCGRGKVRPSARSALRTRDGVLTAVLVSVSTRSF